MLMPLNQPMAISTELYLLIKKQGNEIVQKHFKSVYDCYDYGCHGTHGL
jgi:hypothetical protein